MPHPINIFKEEELQQDSVTEEFSVTAEDGKNYRVKHYNLDTIIAVGYRVNSKFISRCIALAEEKGEFELAPITGNNTFLRWSSDRDSNAWSYYSFIVVFQRRSDAKLKNGYRNGALYVLELNFVDFEIPMANVARYDYDNTIKNWSTNPISPSDHWILYQPMYNGLIEFPSMNPEKCIVEKLPNLLNDTGD